VLLAETDQGDGVTRVMVEYVSLRAGQLSLRIAAGSTEDLITVFCVERNGRSNVLGRDGWRTPITVTGNSQQNLGQEQMAKRTRELVFKILWSYVKEMSGVAYIKAANQRATIRTACNSSFCVPTQTTTPKIASATPTNPSRTLTPTPSIRRAFVRFSQLCSCGIPLPSLSIARV
jgi:hypothetical protein